MIGKIFGRVIAIVSLLFALPGLFIAWLLEPRRRDVVAIALRSAVPEEPSSISVPRFLRRFLPEPRTSFLELLATLELAKKDARVRAVLIELDRAPLPLAWVEEAIAEIEALRARGKKVFAWVDSAGPGGLALAAACDRVWLPPVGILDVLGLRLRAVFLRGALDKVGIVPEMLHVGPWKTASDTFMRRDMTPEHEAMLAALGDDLWTRLVHSIAQGRKLAPGEVAAALDDAPVAHETARERKLACDLVRPDELEDRIGKELGAEKPPIVPHVALLARDQRRERIRFALRSRPPLVAVVPLRGAILPGDEPPSRGQAAPSQPLVELLESLRDDDDVSAVVLRIDSPGGSATASDEIWRAAKRLDEKRPVIASLGRVAASGGYYAAVGARRIVAAPSSITGSIGVVMGKAHVAPLLEKLGVGIGAIERGARAGMFSPERGFTRDEHDAVEREMDRFYQAFLDRVAESRKRPKSAIDDVGRGRVFTGRQALEKGLVDELGGLRRAIEVALEAAGHRGAEPLAAFVKPRPRRSSPLSWITSLDDRARGPLERLGQDALVIAELFAREPFLALELSGFDGI